MAEQKKPESFYIASLIVKHLKDELTTTEQEELNAWLMAGEQNRALFRELTDADALEKQMQILRDTDTDAAWQSVEQKLVIKQTEQVSKRVAKIWWRAAAAVFILAVAGLAIWYGRFNEPAIKPALASRFGEDVLPGIQKARLVLSNGNTVLLNNGIDSILNDNGHTIHIADGDVVYGQATLNASTAFNTLHVPRGGEYMMVLSDGTKVWLNSASALRYPVQFNGSERRVELLEGEAYFEVAKNTGKPFKVITNHVTIQDIGTAFNVNSYTNAAGLVTATLTEGIIQVTAAQQSIRMQPGEQVQANELTAKVSKTDTAMAIAWKNGLFMFSNTALEQVTEQISRWYDVAVVYDESFKQKKFFTGEIKRTLPLSKILEMMELTGIASFSITNNTLMIKPYISKQDK
ncbi:MAG TPA: FecR domain-containing protein [Parafilimonas sp.]|nr:FecR domain-containing protein [Parafilimonas sp.]